MVNKRFALNQLFTEPCNGIPGGYCPCLFGRVSFLNSRLRVPIFTVAFNQQVSRRDVEIKHVSLADIVFAHDAQTGCLNEFPRNALNGRLSRKLSVAHEGAKASIRCLAGCWSEVLATRSALKDNGRAAAYLRAIGSAAAICGRIAERLSTPGADSVLPACPTTVGRTSDIPIGVRVRNAEGLAAYIARFNSLTRAALSRAMHFCVTAACLKWKLFSARLTGKRRSFLRVSTPPFSSRAGSATATKRGSLSSRELFSAIRANVNVIFSQGVTSLTGCVQVEPQGCISTFAARSF